MANSTVRVSLPIQKVYEAVVAEARKIAPVATGSKFHVLIRQREAIVSFTVEEPDAGDNGGGSEQPAPQ